MMDFTKKLAVGALLLVFSVLALGSIITISGTPDEITHITVGHTYLHFFDYTFNPEHPPLVKVWAAIPSIFMDTTFPAHPTEYEGHQWDYTKEYLYHSGNDADTIVFWSKIMVFLISLVLGYYIYKWAAELFGFKAGLFALFLYAFDPTGLAHSTMVNTDVPFAAALFITIYYFWKFSKEKELSWKHAVALGVLTGISLAMKHTGIYVIPFLALLYLVHVYYDTFNWKEKKLEERFFAFVSYLKTSPHLFRGIIGALVVFGIATITLASTYGFVHFYNYTYGIIDVFSHSLEGHTSGYLLGMHSNDGWFWYQIVAFFVKTPVPTILFFFASLALYFRRKDTDMKTAWFLLLPSALYFISFMINKINIGVRHIYPCYPFIFVFTSSLLVFNWDDLGKEYAKFKPYVRYVFLFFVAWLMVSTIFAYPNFISYFNEAVGGSSNGHKFLLDSNLDWGQGLKDTSIWLEEQGRMSENIYITYFGNEEISYRGFAYNPVRCAPTPGLQVISANFLYDLIGNQYGCVEWLHEYEPIKVIRGSIYIFDITDPDVIQRHEHCKYNCEQSCTLQGGKYKDSLMKEDCICMCDSVTHEELGIV